MSLVKGDITRNTKSTSSRVITPIALMLSVVAQKDTRNRLSRELGTLAWRKQNIAPTAKNMKMSVAWETREKTLIYILLLSYI